MPGTFSGAGGAHAAKVSRDTSDASAKFFFDTMTSLVRRSGLSRMWCRGKRSGICGYCDHVLNRQPSHHCLHRLRSGRGPRTRFEGEEWANEISGIAAGERRNEAYAGQRCAMTSDARDDEPV